MSNLTLSVGMPVSGLMFRGDEDTVLEILPNLGEDKDNYPFVVKYSQINDYGYEDIRHTSVTIEGRFSLESESEFDIILNNNL